MAASAGGSGGFSDINVTPLIDIVLVVLIGMMVNIPIQIEEMGLKLPSSEVTPPDVPPDVEQLVIALYAPEKEGDPGKIALNRKAMPEQEMRFEITRRLRSMTNKNVFIDAHEAVLYGQLVDMVDLAREAGAGQVGLAKMKDEGPLAITSVSPGVMPRGVVLGTPQVRGEIDAIKADASIQPLKGSIEQCYLQRLAVKPDLTGSFTVYVEVGPQGELLKPPAIEGDETGDSELVACVLPVLPNLRYSPLGEGLTAWVRYLVLFSPG